DAIGARSEIDTIEIELEDLRFREFPLQPEREQGFLELARDRAFLRKKQILCKLLRDRRSALGDAEMQDVCHQRARDSVRIDAAMFVEPPVLDCDERLGDVSRQFPQRQRRAGEIAAACKCASLIIDDLDGGRPFGDLKRLDWRQMRAHPDDKTGSADAEPKTDDE